MLHRFTALCCIIVTFPLACFPQVVINEIMQNPLFIGDTDGEWFELFNAGSASVDIDGWTIRDDGSNNHVISNGGPLLIPVNGFLVLGRTADPKRNGNVPVAYEYGSSITLGNGSDQIILEDAAGGEIDRVEYDDGATFPDPDGASMELVHFLLDNNEGTHWLEASSSWGGGDKGTPGSPNSRLDTIPPVLVRATGGESLVTVQFDEPLDEQSATVTSHYSITPSIGTPLSAVLDSVSHSAVFLTVPPLAPGVLYTLRSEYIGDQAGNLSGPDSTTFMPEEPPRAGDIIITEIMKDPVDVSDANGEWFEVYNTTDHEIDLLNWVVTDRGSNTFTIRESFIVRPGQFGIFIVNTDSATNGGVTAETMYDWGSSSTFTLGNGEDKVVLLSNGVTIDSVSYDDGANWPDPSGASLGLSDFTLDNNTGANWTPAGSREPSFNGTAGDLGSPGTLGSNQSTGAAAQIEVDPPTLTFTLYRGDRAADTLLITNTGSAVLDWSAQVDTGSCTLLTLAPDSGMIPPDMTDLLGVFVNTVGIDPAVYQCTVQVRSNDPLRPEILIPVTVEVRDTLVAGSILIPDEFLPIPAKGDTVDMVVGIRNPRTVPVEADAWITLLRPGTQTPKEIVPARSFAIAPRDSLTRTRRLPIPAHAPAGQYELVLNIGTYPDSVTTSARFLFEKSAVSTAGIDIDVRDEGIPDRNYLAHSYPNPFNPSVTIPFGLAERTWVTLSVYDILGNEIAKLVDDLRDSGTHNVVWTGRNRAGSMVSSGVYIYQIRASGFVSHGRMLLMR